MDIDNIKNILDQFVGRTVDSNLIDEITQKCLEECDCYKCDHKVWWMIVCDILENKRYPYATNHDNACTNSNEPGQKGSDFE